MTLGWGKDKEERDEDDVEIQIGFPKSHGHLSLDKKISAVYNKVISMKNTHLMA